MISVYSNCQYMQYWSVGSVFVSGSSIDQYIQCWSVLSVPVPCAGTRCSLLVGRCSPSRPRLPPCELERFLTTTTQRHEEVLVHRLPGLISLGALSTGHLASCNRGLHHNGTLTVLASIDQHWSVYAVLDSIFSTCPRVPGITARCSLLVGRCSPSRPLLPPCEQKTLSTTTTQRHEEHLITRPLLCVLLLLLRLVIFSRLFQVPGSRFHPDVPGITARCSLLVGRCSPSRPLLPPCEHKTRFTTTTQRHEEHLIT